MSSEAEIRKRKIYRVTFVGFVVNLVLSVLKLAAGIVGRSGAMVADAVHSFSDLATDVVVIAFARISAKPRDDGHDYGPREVRNPRHDHHKPRAGDRGGPGFLPAASATSASWSTADCCPGRGWWPSWRPGCRSSSRRFSTATPSVKAVRSTARASWPMPGTTGSDALSSLGTLVGIACAYFLGQKWRIADPIAALVVAVFIFKVAFDLVRTGLNELLERSLPADVEEEILRIVTADPEVCQPHNLRTRRIGAAIAVEVHVRMDGAMTVARSHALTVDIERRLRARFGEGTMIAIHVEPLK